MRLFSGTTRRLVFGFGAVVLFFGVASSFALAGLAEVHDSLHSVKHHEEGVRQALQLASAVRDQYAHQAHTIILGNTTHLHFYRGASERVHALARQVAAQADSAEERAWAGEIEEASTTLDRLFESEIVPAVVAHDQERVQQAHLRAQEIVGTIQARADTLAEKLEAGIGSFEEHAGAVQHATIRWTLVFSLAAMAFALAVGVYIARSVARPVATLSAGAARLAGGDLSTRIDIRTDDEFGALARQFNAMTAAVKEHQERLVQSEKLAGIGRLAAGVAHEINNPLAVIRGYAKLLKKKAEGDLAEDLAVVEDEALRCQEIVEGLLELARPGRPADEAVSLRELATEVVERLREAGQLGQVAVLVDGDARIEGSAQKLRQVLVNVVKNAVEASAPDGRVQVRLSADDGAARLVVADSGRGITPENQAKLFEPFFTTKAKGTGLGLAVSQAIVQAHGGRIALANGPAGGAEVVIELPGRAA